eukprot:scaffold6312_cov85-Cylindrotheca_fusiformis.AAC.8
MNTEHWSKESSKGGELHDLIALFDDNILVRIFSALLADSKRHLCCTTVLLLPLMALPILLLSSPKSCKSASSHALFDTTSPQTNSAVPSDHRPIRFYPYADMRNCIRSRQLNQSLYGHGFGRVFG